MIADYPRIPLLGAIEEAARYGMVDVDRLERMVLRRIASDFFNLRPSGAPEGDRDR